MKKRSRAGKMIAPLVVTALMALWLLFYAGGLFLAAQELPYPMRLLLAAVPFGVLCAGVAMLVERIREIRSGEEDDLDHY